MIYVNTQVDSRIKAIGVTPETFPALYDGIHLARTTDIKLTAENDLIIQSIDSAEMLTEKVNEFIADRKSAIMNNIKKQLKTLCALNDMFSETDKQSDVSKILRLYNMFD